MRCVAAGSIDDMSISSFSGFAACATPLGPNSAASTMSAWLRLKITKDAVSVAAAGDVAGLAPSAASLSSFAVSRSKTCRRWPRSRSLVAMALPMMPAPITAMSWGMDVSFAQEGFGFGFGDDIIGCAVDVERDRRFIGTGHFQRGELAVEQRGRHEMALAVGDAAGQ